MSKAKRNIIQFTYDIEEFIEYIQEEMVNKSFNDFALDKKSIGYIERQLEKIGEAITQIQKLDKDILTKIYDNKSYWEGIKGVRNRLIHEYWGTSIQMIYEISVDEMDELLDYIKQIRELEKSQIS